MMDPLETETKPWTSKSPCLICSEPQEGEESVIFSGGVIEGPEENDKIFTLLCKSLKIKMTKKNSWDFTKEPLPFCPTCLEISREVVEIQEHIQLLQFQYSAKVSDLRNLILQSESKDSHLKDSQVDNQRFLYFRHQVTQPEKQRGLESQKSRPSSAFVILGSGDKNLNSVIEEHETIITRPRRSGRVKRQPIPTFSDSGEFQKEILEDGDFKEDRSNESAINPTNVNLAVEIKDEPQSEDEPSELFHNLEDEDESSIPFSAETSKKIVKSKRSVPKEIFENLSTSKTVKSSTPTTAKETKTKIKAKSKSSKRRKPRKSVAQSGSEDSEDYGSDFRPEKLGDSSSCDENSSDAKLSDYDDEGRKRNVTSTRLWTGDKKSGILWYDGVEVYLVDTGLKCSICEEVIVGPKDTLPDNKNKMKRHINFKHQAKFVCPVCDKIMSSQRCLNQHIQVVHDKSVTISCEICEKPFTSMRAKRRHSWNHLNQEEKQAALAVGKKQFCDSERQIKVLQCGQCGKMCKGPYVLKKHEETHIDLSERSKHMCQICGGLYSAPENLKSHIKRKHENNCRLQWLQCPHCPMKFPTQSRLKQHVRTHTGEKPHKCPECGAGFNTSRLLQGHILRHKNIRPHKCDHCDMSFFQKYHLKRHRMVYHESANPPARKLPYRSENGTRRTPQKRSKKRDLNKPVGATTTRPVISSSLQNEGKVGCDRAPVASGQFLGGVTNVAEPSHFSFESTESGFPYHNYFPSRGGMD